MDKLKRTIPVSAAWDSGSVRSPDEISFTDELNEVEVPRLTTSDEQQQELLEERSKARAAEAAKRIRELDTIADADAEGKTDEERADIRRKYDRLAAMLHQLQDVGDGPPEGWQERVFERARREGVIKGDVK